MSKKGAGEVVSTLILFIAVVSITASIVLVFRNFATQTTDSFKVQGDIVNNQLKTYITIPDAYYNSTTKDLYIYVKNIGETNLLTNYFDIYIDKFYVTNFSVKNPVNLSENLTLLQPQQTAVIVRNINLTTGTHSVKVVTQYGSYAEAYFNN